MKRNTSETSPLRVDFIEDIGVAGRLGVTIAPGKKGPSNFSGTEWDRDLDTDLKALVDTFGVDILVSLMEEHEYEMLEIPDLLDRARVLGMETHHLPIADVSIPRPDREADTNALIARVAADLRAGKTVVAHCRGGLGRSGLIAAAILSRLGHDADEAIAKVRLAREGAIETRAQEDWIRACAREHAQPTTQPTTRQRYHGAMLGLAAADALGTTVEFKPPGTFEPLTDIVGGGPFGLEAGQWTDDTSMALCLAESLIEQQAFDPEDQMKRYVRWWKEGHLSSTGRCFDIGVTTSNALAKFDRTGEPYAGSTDPNSAGNGAIMRLAPVPLAFAADPKRAIELAGDSARTTHDAETCVDASRYFAGLIIGAVMGASKSELLEPMYSPVPGLWRDEPLHLKIAEVAGGSFLRKEPPEIKGTGYVVESLEAALWAFAKSTDFQHGALLAVNLGNDADTTGAVYGQIAGAFYGVESIPESWREKLVMKKEIEAFTDGLLALAENGELTGAPNRG